MLAQTFAPPPESARGATGLHFPADVFHHTLSMQKSNIALAKTQQGHLESEADDSVDLPAQHSDVSHAAPCAVVVDLPLAQKGPAAVARHLIEKARCTEEQITAIAGLARDWQNAWDARTNKESHLFTGADLARPAGNHRAVWLGGGGV